MTADSAPPSRFRALGSVAEILDRDGCPRVLVVLDAGALIEVAIDSAGDVHLGDRVSVEGSLALNGRAEASAAVTGVPPDETGSLVARRVRAGGGNEPETQ